MYVLFVFILFNSYFLFFINIKKGDLIFKSLILEIEKILILKKKHVNHLLINFPTN